MKSQHQEYFFKNLQLAGFPLSPILSVYPLVLCLKFVNVEFLSLLPHKGVFAVDLLQQSYSHITLIMAWQIEVVPCGLSFTFPQQIVMLGDISLVLFEALLNCLVASGSSSHDKDRHFKSLIAEQKFPQLLTVIPGPILLDMT